MITKFNIFLTTLADTLSTHSVSADAARPWQLMFQDPATPIAEGVMDFHNDLMFVVVFVLKIITLAEHFTAAIAV